MVVGLDIEYKTSSKDQPKTATISLWRPKHNVTGRAEMELVAEQSVTDLICPPTNYDSTSSTNNRRNFATKPAANPSIQAGLRLQLCHFAIEVIVENYANLRVEIFISCQQLFDSLASSEAKAAKKRELNGRAKNLPAGAKKWRRTATPPDQLDADDEKYYENLERRASKY